MEYITVRSNHLQSSLVSASPYKSERERGIKGEGERGLGLSWEVVVGGGGGEKRDKW
jgi:hypothetical protein